MNKKYELTQETTRSWDGTKLFRIKALSTISNVVNKGELGGFIETEANLDTSGNAWVYGNAWVSGNAWVYGGAWVSGNARVYGGARVSFGFLVSAMFENNKPTQAYIASSLNVYPIKGWYYLYKRVLKTDDGVYTACYDSKTTYKDGKVTRIKNYDTDVAVSCSQGIHCSTPFYYSEGDCLIAVKVRVEDVITCQEGKLRCKAVTTIGEVKI